MYGFGDYNAWCYKSAAGTSQITVAAPGVIDKPGCSGQAPGAVQPYLDGTITCLSAPTGGFNTDCSPITGAASSCFGIPGDPSVCLSFIPVQTYTALGIAGILAMLMLRRGK